MSEDPQNPSQGPFRYHLELTPAQLKITHTALHSLLDDFGHDQSDVHGVIREVLDKLPDEHAMRAVRLDEELERELREAGSPSVEPETGTACRSSAAPATETGPAPPRPETQPHRRRGSAALACRLPMSLSVQIGLLFAVATAFASVLGFLYKHRGAVASAEVEWSRPVRTSLALFRNRWYTLGIVIATIGWGFHVAALALAPISLVQSVIAGGLVLLTVIADRLFAHRVTRREWIGVGLAALGPRLPRRDARGRRRRGPLRLRVRPARSSSRRP